MSTTRLDAELEVEREHIAFLYQRLDAERAAARAELDARLRDSADTGEEARWSREVAVRSLRDRVNRLRVADSGLCFGRTEDTAGRRTYIGRIGLFDADDDYEPLLTDWRAPAARPFYCATAARPEGLAARRHFRTSNRRLLDFHDEALALGEQAGAGDPDGALMAALNAPRTEVMRDIVATIQAEQDEIIRLGHGGVVVIEGGPGTGKTAVALHRVAYLLYDNRERLARRGVLMIGPNPGFLRYVGQVLPSLGETDVVFATPGELLPGLRATAEDTPAARRIKGSAVMVDVLRAAIADREALPETPIPIELDDVTVPLDAEVAEHARWKARSGRLRHNEATGVFRTAVIEALAERAVREIGRGWLNTRGGDTEGLTEQLTQDVRIELATSAQLDAAVGRLWPTLNAQRLLAGLLSSRARLDTAAAVLTEGERAALHRTAGAAWTVSDVPLLDEATELLGRDDSAEKAAERRRERARREYAEGVLEILDTEEDPDGEVLRAVDLLDSAAMAERQTELDTRDLAERAAADREWTYGHVVVDEAQELSAMDWRVLMRRCPGRSMTIVGDLAQRQSRPGRGAGRRCWTRSCRAGGPTGR